MRPTSTVVLALAALFLAVQVVLAEALRATSAVGHSNLAVVNLNEAMEKPTPKPKPAACWKEGEARGAGVLPNKENKECPQTHPEKSMGLCYATCKNPLRRGLGPLCWDDCAKMTYTSNGIVFCCDTDDTCSALVSDLAIKLPQALVRFFVDISVNPANVLKILKDFRELVHNALELNLPLCEKTKTTAADLVALTEPEVSTRMMRGSNLDEQLLVQAAR